MFIVLISLLSLRPRTHDLHLFPLLPLLFSIATAIVERKDWFPWYNWSQSRLHLINVKQSTSGWTRTRRRERRKNFPWIIDWRLVRSRRESEREKEGRKLQSSDNVYLRRCLFVSTKRHVKQEKKKKKVVEKANLNVDESMFELVC